MNVKNIGTFLQKKTNEEYIKAVFIIFLNSTFFSSQFLIEILFKLSHR